MTLDLRDVEVFLAVVRQTGRAATELTVTQPAIVEVFRHLERVIGGRLFDRTSRRAVLTPPGQPAAVRRAVPGPRRGSRRVRTSSRGPPAARS